MLIWTHDSLRFLTCPFLFPPTCILNPLPIAAAGGRMDFLASCVSPCLFSFVQVTFPYPQSLPRVTLLTFLLVSNLSPYPLSTTVLLSRSPAFGTERIVFLLFPFFPCPCSLSQRFLHFSPHSCCSRFWDPRFPLSPMCSHLCPYLANFFLLAVLSRL